MGHFDNDISKKPVEDEVRNTEMRNKSPRKIKRQNSPRKDNLTYVVKAFSQPKDGFAYKPKLVEKRSLEKKNGDQKLGESLSQKLAVCLKSPDTLPYHIENFLKEGASAKFRLDLANGSTILHCAAGFHANYKPNLECLDLILQYSTPDEIATCDNMGMNIIHYAALYNKTEVMKLIVERLSKEKPKISHKIINEKAISIQQMPPHPNHSDSKSINHLNRTPLHMAAVNHNEKIIKYLISCNADGNVRDVNNQVALELALLSDAPQVVIDSLMTNTKVLKVMKKCLNNFSINDCRNVIYKLAKMGVNFNLRNRKNLTPIMIAAQFGDTELLRELILLAKQGKTEGLEAKDENLHTALHSACSWGHVDCVRILIDNGANYEAKDNQSNTPLARASQWGRHEIVELLLEKGANANAISGFNKAPIELAFSKGISNCNSPHWECIDLLIPFSDFSRLLFSNPFNEKVAFYAR